MDNDKFKLLTSVLECLEKEDARRSDLEGAIVKIIDRFDSNLTNEQKEEILKEFVHYERIRRKKDMDRKTITEDEKNRELLESFLAGETFKW